MSDERVSKDLRDGVLTLTLDRPEKQNALDMRMIGALHECLDGAELDAAVRVVLLRGAGTDFCAGADPAELLASADLSREENAKEAGRLGSVFCRIRSLSKVVVAGVHGRAFAGGCGLATACDLVLAHEEASFGYPEAMGEFAPAVVMAVLRRSVAEKTAFDLVSTGRILSAAEALRAGLVSRVLSGATFVGKLSEIVDTLAAGSGSALARAKRQFYEIDGMAFNQAIALGARLDAVARSAPDFRKLVSEFFGKDDTLRHD